MERRTSILDGSITGLSIIFGGVGEDVCVGDALVGLVCVVGGEDVVAEIAEEDHHVDGEVFVGVEINHGLGRPG